MIFCAVCCIASISSYAIAPLIFARPFDASIYIQNLFLCYLMTIINAISTICALSYENPPHHLIQPSKVTILYNVKHVNRATHARTPFIHISSDVKPIKQTSSFQNSSNIISKHIAHR